MGNRLGGLTQIIGVTVLSCLFCPVSIYADDLSLSLDKEGKRPQLRFEFEPSATGGAFPLYLHNGTNSTKNRVAIKGLLYEGTTPLAGVSLKFIAPNSEDNKPGLFDVAPDAPTLVYLAVSSLGKVGEFPGVAEVLVGDTVTTTVPFTVVRAGTPELKLQPATADNAVKLTVTTQTFTFPLALMETRGESEANATATLGPVTREDGIVTSSNAVTMVEQNQAITIPARGFHLLTLNGSLPEPAKYQTWIRVAYGKQSQVYNVSIDRKERADFVVVGATNTGLVIPIGSRTLKHQLIIQCPPGQPKNSTLRLALSALTREDGQQAPDSRLNLSQDGPFPLVVGEQVAVDLNGENLEPGKYSTQLLLSSGGRTQVLPIEINRAALSQNISLEDPGATQSTIWCGYHTVNTKVLLNETLGREAHLYYPKIESLQKINAKSASIELTHHQLSMSRFENNSWAPVLSPAKGTATQDPLVRIGPRGNLEYLFGIEGLGAGKYKGRVAISGPDVARQTKEFEIYVKHGFLYAWLVIVVGVGFSFAWNYYSRVRRQQMVRLANVARMEEAIKSESAGWSDKRVWSFLLSQLVQIKKSVRDDPSLKQGILDEQLLDIQERRKFNRMALLEWRNLEQILAEYPAYLGAVQTELRQRATGTMERIVAELRQPEKLGPDDATGAPKLISDLKGVSTDAKSKLIAEPAAKLLTACKQFRAEISLEQPKKLDVEIGIIEAEVKAIVDAATAGNLNGLSSKLQAVYHRFIALGQQQIQKLISAMQATREASEHEPALWEAFDEAIQQVLDSLNRALEDNPPAALAALQAANRQLQLAQIEYLSALASVSRPGDIDEGAWNGWVQKYRVRELIAQTRNDYNTSDDKLQEAYQQAKEAFLALQIEALNSRIDRVKVLVKTPPEFANQDRWDEQLKEEPLQSAIEHLTRFQPVENEVTVDRELRWRVAQNEFLRNRVNALEAALGAVKEHVTAQTSKVIRTQLINTEKALKEAKSQLDEYLKPGPAKQQSLVQAEQAGIAAQRQYDALIRLKPKTEMNLIEGELEHIRPPDAVGAFGELFDMTTSSRPDAHSEAGLVSQLMERLSLRDVDIDASSDDIIRQIKTLDSYVSWLAVILASIGGLLGLYFTNDTWGAPQDYLIAFLWGFGLHEAGNGIIDNLTTKGLWPQEK